MEPLEIFKKYAPIKAIYENDKEYICLPETDTEPLAIYFDKKCKEYKEVYFYASANIVDDFEKSKQIYGIPLSWEDDDFE